jgi:hypothetical protein
MTDALGWSHDGRPAADFLAPKGRPRVYPCAEAVLST